MRPSTSRESTVRHRHTRPLRRSDGYQGWVLLQRGACVGGPAALLTRTSPDVSLPRCASSYAHGSRLELRRGAVLFELEELPCSADLDGRRRCETVDEFRICRRRELTSVGSCLPRMHMADSAQIEHYFPDLESELLARTGGPGPSHTLGTCRGTWRNARSRTQAEDTAPGRLAAVFVKVFWGSTQMRV